MARRLALRRTPVPKRRRRTASQPVQLENGRQRRHRRPRAACRSTRRAPAPGEVEIRVVAAGLNFRDVMNAVAMRDDPEPLGGECAGRVVAVGAASAGFAVGDDVVAVAEAQLRDLRHDLGARWCAPMPHGIELRRGGDAAVRLHDGADYALHALGGLTPRRAVLIHAGAGGVGMAAVQTRAGARREVFATAGSDGEARAAARSASRTCSTRARSTSPTRCSRVTGGRGVDVVLNSLAGEFIGASVRCLTPAGASSRSASATSGAPSDRAGPAAGAAYTRSTGGDAHAGSGRHRPRCSRACCSASSTASCGRCRCRRSRSSARPTRSASWRRPGTSARSC